MLQSYLSTLIRQILRFKSSYAINILGLAFGLACCLICYTHIRYEFSFDDFHASGDRTYRLITSSADGSSPWVKSAAPMAPKLKAEVPEIADYMRLNGVSWSDRVMVESDGKLFLEPGFLMADPSFFTFFDFHLRKGDKSSVLADPNSIVVSEAIAGKLFGDEDPLGKIIRLKDNNLDFQVTGVMKDLPMNTHLRCDYLISFENLERVFGVGRKDAWSEYNYFSYLKLHPGSDVGVVESKIRAIAFELPNKNLVSFESFRLQPMRSIHFQDNRGNIRPSYDIRYIYIFATLALCVLIICAMNYFNIAAMLSIKRVKEIGVRKAVGASSKQLNYQFMSESIGITLFSLLLALLLVELVKPFAGTLLGSPVSINYTDPAMLVFLAALVLSLAVASGGYLTLYINRIKPSLILKGSQHGAGGSRSFQHGLIFIQFSLSIILLISSFVIVRQMRFLHNKDLGFDREQVVSIAMARDVSLSARNTLKTELGNSALVESAGFSDFVPGRANWNQTTWWEGQIDAESMFVIAAGKDFITAMKMELVEGSVEEIESGTEIQYLVNQAAVNHIGWKSGKGKFVSPFGEPNKKAITAVVKDFNYRSLHNEIAPLVVVIYPERKFSQLSVRLKGESLRAGIQVVEKIFKSVTGGLPFEFNLMSDRIDQLYESEIRMENTVVILTIIAIGFALLGIYTLISFTIENRTKEIAIRKVLGVSSQSLLSLFTTSYFKLALVASLVAIPVCWKLLSSWLSGFNEHVDLNVFGFLAMVFLMIGFVMIIGLPKFIALSQVNPARALKSE